MCCETSCLVKEVYIMGKTNSCDLREDEYLAEAVQNFPCLYDKNCKDYREKYRVASAWRTVEQKLGYDTRLQRRTPGAKYHIRK